MEPDADHVMSGFVAHEVLFGKRLSLRFVYLIAEIQGPGLDVARVELNDCPESKVRRHSSTGDRSTGSRLRNPDCHPFMPEHPFVNFDLLTVRRETGLELTSGLFPGSFRRRVYDDLSHRCPYLQEPAEPGNPGNLTSGPDLVCHRSLRLSERVLNHVVQVSTQQRLAHAGHVQADNLGVTRIDSRGHLAQ